VLLDAPDLLAGPTSVASGRRGTHRKSLYITNSAIPMFTSTFRPSLMRLRLAVPGAPCLPAHRIRRSFLDSPCAGS
jgi:hypothetical protein